MNCQYCVHRDNIIRYGTDYDDNPIYCCTVSQMKFTDGIHGPSCTCDEYYDRLQYDRDQAAERRNALRKKADEQFAIYMLLKLQDEEEEENNNREEPVYQRSQETSDPASNILFLLPFAGFAFAAYNWGVAGLKAYGIFLVVLSFLIYNGIISISEGSLLYKLYKLAKNIITVGLRLGELCLLIMIIYMIYRVI